MNMKLPVVHEWFGYVTSFGNVGKGIYIVPLVMKGQVLHLQGTARF